MGALSLSNFSSIKLVFTVALKQEVPDVFSDSGVSCVSGKALLAGDYRALAEDETSLCIVTGVGKASSEAIAGWVSEHIRPWCVVNIGSAGGLDDSVSVGDLCCPKRFLSLDGDDVSGIGVFPFLSPTPILSVDSLMTVDVTGQVFEKASLVDMEAFWQASVFAEAGIYFTALKYITDMNSGSVDRDVLSELPRLRKRFDMVFRAIFSLSERPSISVIIPTFNRAVFLARAIDSVLNQTLSVECIVVDDGSTDETTAVLDRYKDEIKVIELSSNRGVSVARNAGISVASGEWISFLDSDDEWVLDKCESQWNFLKQAPFLRWIQSNETWIRLGQVVNQKKYHAKKAGFIFDFCLDRCMVSPSSVMIHRDVFAYFGVFDPDFLACEDYELWLRFSRNLLIGLDESVSLRKYAGHEGQLSNQVCLDRYRVQALERVLGSGKARPFLDRVTDVLEKKKDILVQGALKRG